MMRMSPSELLLLCFENEDIEMCPCCAERRLLPDWASPHGRICASCGMLSLQGLPVEVPVERVTSGSSVTALPVSLPGGSAGE